MSAEPGSDDEPYGEVQRVASSSTAAPAAPAPNPDDVANYSTLLQEHARSVFSRASDSKGKLWRSSIPQAEEQRLAPPSWTDAELSTFYLSLARHSRLRPDLIAQDLGGTKTVVQVAHYLNLLQDASDAVDAQRSKTRSRAAALKRHAAAIEVDDDWVQREEELAEACRLPQRTNSTLSPRFSWTDDKVAAAAIYVMHNSKAESEVADASNAPAVYRFSSLVASLRVPASRRSRGQVRGDVQKGYRDFVLAHPQAPSLEEMRQRGDGKRDQPSRKMHGTKRRRTEGREGNPDSEGDDEQDGQDEDGHDSSSAAHRLVLRMCELGLLWRVVDGDDPGSSDVAADQAVQAASRLQIAAPLYHPTATVVHQFSTAHKALHITSAQPQRLPTLFLDTQRVVWATDVTAEEQEALLPTPPPANEGQGISTFKHSMRRRIAAGRASLIAAKAAALDRLLSSVRCEELDWLEGGVFSDVNPDFAAQSGDDSVEANRGGRGRRSSTFRGHSLEGMSDKERELFKARIRKEDQKKSLDELNGWSRGAMSPATPNAASSSSSSSSPPALRASSPPSGKRSLLDPFKPLLQPLSRPQRLKAEARLRKRVRLWGLEKTMQVGLGSLDVDVRLQENRAVRRRSASGDVASPATTAAEDASDELGHPDVAAALQAAYASQSQPNVGPQQGGDTARGQDASGQDDEFQAPSRPLRTRHDARSARFRAIGVTEAKEVIERLRALAQPLLAETSTPQHRAQEVTQLISLRSLARLVRVSADGTRDDDRDATEHHSSSPLGPGQVDLAPLLVFLCESLRSYLSHAVSSLAVKDSHHHYSQLNAKDVHNALREAGLKLKADWIGRVEGEEEDEHGEDQEKDEEWDDEHELNRSRKVRDGLVLDWQQRRGDGDDVSFDIVDAHYAPTPTHVRLANAMDQRSKRSLGHQHTAYSLSSENELLGGEESEDDVFESREEADEVAHVRSQWRSSSGGGGSVSWPSGPDAPAPPGLTLPFEHHDGRELQVAEHLEGDEDFADVPGDVDLPAVPQVEVRVGGEEDVGADGGRRRRPEAQVVADAQEGIRDERKRNVSHVDVVRHGVGVEVGVRVEVEVEVEGEGESGDEGMERRDADMDRVFVAREQGLWLGVSQSSSW